jgi:hypothetical protein
MRNYMNLGRKMILSPSQAKIISGYFHGETPTILSEILKKAIMG